MKTRQQKAKERRIKSNIFTYSLSIIAGLVITVVLVLICVWISPTYVNVGELEVTENPISHYENDSSDDVEDVEYDPDITASIFIEKIDDEPEQVEECNYNVSKDYCQSDLDLLAAIVHLEGCLENDECQRAIASVVINRALTGNKSIEYVIFEPNQFSPASQVPYTTPCETCYRNAEYILNNGPTLPRYVTYFRADYYFDWGPRYKNYAKYDKTYFSYDTQLYDKYN